VDDVACYQTVADTDDWNGHAARLAAEGADWLTFASGSGVRCFHERFDLPLLLKQFPQMRVASIGPETSQCLAALEVKPALEAKVHTVDGLITALEQACRRKGAK
jgi:uroporphyrinogen III methyltransferase/synthase